MPRIYKYTDRQCSKVERYGEFLFESEITDAADVVIMHYSSAIFVTLCMLLLWLLPSLFWQEFSLMRVPHSESRKIDDVSRCLSMTESASKATKREWEYWMEKDFV